MASIKFNLEIERNEAEITPPNFTAEVEEILTDAAEEIQSLFTLKEGYEACGHEKHFTHSTEYQEESEETDAADDDAIRILRSLFGGK